MLNAEFCGRFLPEGFIVKRQAAFTALFPDEFDELEIHISHASECADDTSCPAVAFFEQSAFAELGDQSFGIIRNFQELRSCKRGIMFYGNS